MREHIRYQVFLGSRLLGEVFVLDDRYIHVIKKARKGLICKKVSA